MQTMPNKTRNAVAIGAVLLALAVGAFALWSGRTQQPAAPQTTENQATLPTDQTDTAGNETEPTDEPATAATGGTLNPSTGTTPATGTATEVPETHVVKEGETLRTIAQKYYNNADYSGDIEVLNELEDPDHIPVGMELKLPRPADLHQESDDDN